MRKPDIFDVVDAVGACVTVAIKALAVTGFILFWVILAVVGDHFL